MSGADATLDELREALIAAQTVHGSKYPVSLIERFGDPGATIGTLTGEQRTALVGYLRAEEREREATEEGPGEIPKAKHLCTDLANANRLRARFGKRLVSVDGVFYAWIDTHWARDDGQVHRYAAQLSAIVESEAKRATAEYNELRKTPEGLALTEAALKHPRKSDLGRSEAGRRLLDAQDKAEMLRGWGAQCEMKARQDAALGLLRNMLTLEGSKLDRNPWLLNCESGTVDLRTGALKAHDPLDYITRCAPVRFDANATASTFERFVCEIVNGNEAVSRFLQRWYGYTATGDTREQVLAIHTGPGANGKGTLLNAISDVLGDYAGTAAPGLLADKGHGSERHPTEIADLRGRRLVTAHESDDAATLREGFVKQATGNDKLKAHFMHKDFFEFAPTHKLQLLTNFKPIIKGQDHAIWRRILLVNYPIKFGTQEEIDSGAAMRLKDMALPEKLHAEREGIFAWLIRGAAAWYRDGLNPPDAVTAASREYKEEQNRIGAFLKELCVLDPDAWAVFGGDYGLFGSYQQWCKENGFNSLARTRFLQELELSIPGFRKVERKILGSSGKRKSALCIAGVRLDRETALREMFMSELDLDSEMADVLVRENFRTIGEVTAETKLTGIKEFDEGIVKELLSRARKRFGEANAST